MSHLEEVKKRGLFASWDLLVYAVLFVLIVLLFLVFVFGGTREQAAGIRVSVEGVEVYTYTYGQGGAVAVGWEKRVDEHEENGLLRVTVYTDEQLHGYNVIEIDEENKSARVIDANCSYHKDCTLMAAVTSESGVIVCVPHGLKILALGGENLTHPTIG